jgi:hypothetical protein
MAATSYLGGELAAHRGLRLPTASGFAIATAGFAVMGVRWNVHSTPVEMGIHLAFIGAGMGLAMTPTTTAIVNAAAGPAGPGDADFGDANGTAAGLVIVFRMIGFSIGLAALTTFGVRRYAALRSGVELPPLTDPTYAQAAKDVARRLSTDALAETFLGAGIVTAAALALSRFLPGRRVGAP